MKTLKNWRQKINDCISIHHLQVSIYSSSCTFGSNYSTEPVWTGFSQLLHIWALQLFPILLCRIAQTLLRVKWESWVNSLFQVQPHILTWTEVWALTQSLQNINAVVLNPFMCSFVCMLAGKHVYFHKPSRAPAEKHPPTVRYYCYLDGDGAFGMMCRVWCAEIKR